MRSGSLEKRPSQNKNSVKKSNNVKKVNELTKKNIIWMFIWLFIAIFVIYQLYTLIMYTLGKKEKEQMWLYNAVNSVVKTVSGFKDISDTTENYTVKFAGIGDIYFTSNTLASSRGNSGYDFTNGMDALAEKLQGYDIVVASLKTPIANSNLGYSTKTVYNAPSSSVIDLLKKLNVSAVATATSHALDKNEKGVSDTISNLTEAEIKQTGISDETRKEPIILSKNNINIGFLSYATSSNVKMTKNNSYLLNVLDDEDLNKDIDYLKSQNVDFIVAYLNVPNEDVLMVNSDQVKATEKLFTAGVNVVLGSGSMVVQENIEEETEKEHVYSIYSLGDLCGSYVTDDNCLNVIANIEFKKDIVKDSEGNVKSTECKMVVNEPIGVWNAVKSDFSRTTYLLNEEISNYDLGKSDISKSEYQKMKKAKEYLASLSNK